MNYADAGPAWLDNYGLIVTEARRQGDYGQVLWDLLAMAPCVERWIDGHVVRGSAENMAVCREALGMFAGVADFSLLGVDHPLAVLRTCVKRLKGVIEGAE